MNIHLALTVLVILAPLSTVTGAELPSLVPAGMKPAAKQPQLPVRSLSSLTAMLTVPGHVKIQYYYGDAHGTFMVRDIDGGAIVGEDLNSPPRYFKGILTPLGHDADFTFYSLDNHQNVFGIARTPDSTTKKFHIIISDRSGHWVDWDDAKDTCP